MGYVESQNVPLGYNSEFKLPLGVMYFSLCLQATIKNVNYNSIEKRNNSFAINVNGIFARVESYYTIKEHSYNAR